MVQSRITRGFLPGRSEDRHVESQQRHTAFEPYNSSHLKKKLSELVPIQF